MIALTLHAAPRLPFRASSDSYADRVPQLIAALQGHGWRTAKALAADLETDDRTIRAIAHASKGQILGGQKGYCLTVEASVADVDHVERFLLSQARAMTDRAREIRIARNR